jgi:hypothetical protein
MGSKPVYRTTNACRAASLLCTGALWITLFLFRLRQDPDEGKHQSAHTFLVDSCASSRFTWIVTLTNTSVWPVSNHDSSPFTQAIGIGNLQRSKRASNNVGQGNKEPLPHGAHKDRSARPQVAIIDDPSKLACLRYPWDGPDESSTACVQRGSSQTARCASTGDSPGHPIPCWRTFSAPC